MIRIKRIYIENFKGIKSGLVVDLIKDIESMVVLSGPNGFGKTTIFDALDICLTGQLYRFKKNESFDGVQKNNRGRSKPYFQNQDGHDVVLKLLLEDDIHHKSYVIIKHYDDSSGVDKINSSKSNIPHESNLFFKTYLTDESGYFDDSDYSGLSEVEQEEVDKLFFEEGSDFKLDSTYYLFNYLQQEENIYFLKKDEDSKGNSLSFLFNIEKEESKKHKLSEILDNLNHQNNILKTNLSNLKETISSTDEVGYSELFESKEFEFDKELPFKGMKEKEVKLNLFNEELDRLIDFKNIFVPNEYEKFVQYNYINKSLLGNKDLIESLLLKNIYSDELLEGISKNNEKIRKVKEFTESDKNQDVKEELFSWLIKVDYEKEYQKYNENIEVIKKINNELGDIGKIISGLLSSRDKSLEDFNYLIEKNQIDENRCPMCDSPFDTYKELIDSISSKTEVLKSYHKVKIEEKEEIVKSIEIIIEKLRIEAISFLETNKEVNEALTARLRSMSNYSELIASSLSKFPEIESAESKELYFVKVPNEEELKANANKLTKFLTEKLLPKYEYNEELIPNRELYSTYFDKKKSSFNDCTIELINKKKNYILHQYNIEANKELNFLEGRMKKLERIKSKTKEIYDKVHESIQSHKREMIEKIKIPFYIYSGKILQSYQQGLGIFIDIRPTGQSNKVWFKTGNSSDHDIVYQLSSGQMAVVSIAFCLSLNKVFNTNKNFKFLAIDDPIQTLDDLNIHTFIELLRHDFIDYQILMSTHDDFTSKYIKYKFDKFGAKTKIRNMQQLVLEQLK